MTNFDDEYKYPEDEFVADDVSDMESADEVAAREMQEDEEDTAVNSESKDGIFAKAQEAWSGLPSSGKRSICIIGFIIVAIIAGCIWVSLTPSVKTKNSIKNTAPTVKLQSAGAITPVASAQVPAMPQQSIQQQADLAKSQAMVNSLQQQITAIKGSLTAALQNNAALQAQVSSLSNQVKQSGQKNTALSQQITTLNNSIAGLKKEVGIAKARKSSMAKDKVQFIEHYTLTGMVSGRAWVMDQYGKTLSVKVGDHLKDFGVVAKIDDSAGFIESRKGQLIEYSLNG